MPRIRPTLFAYTALAATIMSVAPMHAAYAQDKDKAKDTKPECNPNSVATQTLSKATFSMQRAFSAIQATPKRDGSKDLKDAINLLTTQDSKSPSDSVGRSYYLGQAYILLLSQPGIAPVGRRGSYGIATDTSLTIDLLAAADTQFTRVENADPTCRDEMAKWRQQQPWLDAVNGSISALNASQYDSAEALAKRALVIDHRAPYAYTVLAEVANNRKQYDQAAEYLRKALEIVNKDTSYAENRVNIMFSLANTMTNEAKEAKASDQPTKINAAIEQWRTFIPAGGSDMQTAQAVQMIKSLMKMENDTVSYVKAYDQVLANISHFGESTLLNAGLVATNSKRSEDAVKLFSAVLDSNPNQRDALNNLAASYLAAKQPEKMTPLVDRLVTIDPNNDQNWLLYVFAYSALVKSAKDPKLVKQYTDSALYFNHKAEVLTPRLSLTGFNHSAKQTSLAGTIENYNPSKPQLSVSGKPLKNTGPKSTITTRPFTLTVDFLDAKGNVLGTQSVTTNPIAPGATDNFTVTLPDKNAVAFRYKLN